MYHLELRQFPHVQRVFNLERAELDARFVRPWVAGEFIEYEDRRWSPDRTRLKVLEAPTIRIAELSLGQGWGEVTRQATDVTEAILSDARRGAQARPETEALKTAIEEVAATRTLTFVDTVDLAAAARPGWRASEHLALAEQAVWEMLHHGRLLLQRDGEPVPQAEWQAIVLSFTNWTDPGPYQLRTG